MKLQQQILACDSGDKKVRMADYIERICIEILNIYIYNSYIALKITYIGGDMHRIKPFLLLPVFILSSCLVTGCSLNKKEERTFSYKDLLGKTDIIKDLPSSTDIGDVYNQARGQFNLESGYDVVAIEAKISELATKNAGVSSDANLEKKLIVTPNDIDIQLNYTESIDAIFLMGGVYTNVSAIASWESENPKVVNVMQGQLRTDAIGEADINVEYSGIKKKVHVNVIENPNWKKENDAWYYYDTKNNKTKGWKRINWSWYYMDKNGRMLTGWQKIDGEDYYMHSDGQMANDEWVQGRNDQQWYYLNGNGKMSRHKWITIDHNDYYVHSNGQMAMDEWVQKTDGSWYYFLADGLMAKSQSLHIKGINYQFDEKGKLVSSNQFNERYYPMLIIPLCRH